MLKIFEVLGPDPRADGGGSPPACRQSLMFLTVETGQGYFHDWRNDCSTRLTAVPTDLPETLAIFPLTGRPAPSAAGSCRSISSSPVTWQHDPRTPWRADRMIGMIQPTRAASSCPKKTDDRPKLYPIGLCRADHRPSARPTDGRYPGHFDRGKPVRRGRPRAAPDMNGYRRVAPALFDRFQEDLSDPAGIRIVGRPGQAFSMTLRRFISSAAGLSRPIGKRSTTCQQRLSGDRAGHGLSVRAPGEAGDSRGLGPGARVSARRS